MLHAKYQALDVQLFMSSLSNFDRALDKGHIWKFLWNPSRWKKENMSLKHCWWRHACSQITYAEHYYRIATRSIDNNLARVFVPIIACKNGLVFRTAPPYFHFWHTVQIIKTNIVTWPFLHKIECLAPDLPLYNEMFAFCFNVFISEAINNIFGLLTLSVSVDQSAVLSK